jgi:hypothetical protein
VIRARSQGSACNASIRLIEHPVFYVPTVAARCLHVLRDARDPSSERWNFNGRESVAENFHLNADFHVTFRDLLHAANLRHGTAGFTSPPKEGVLGIFFARKNPTDLAGFETTNLGTRGQHASSRPAKPPSVQLPSVIIRMSVDYLTVQYQVPNALATNIVMANGNRDVLVR